VKVPARALRPGRATGTTYKKEEAAPMNTETTRRGRHRVEDFATLTTSQMRVRTRIEMRRLVRLLLPGADLNSHEAPE
jgi:hypothetical protein